jgi:hypothetical protein
MRIRIATADGRQKQIQLHLTDFNRTRWVLFAIRHHAQLQTSLMQCPQDEVLLMDSTSPSLMACLATSPDRLLKGTHLVLWDGLNSVIELFEKAPWLQERQDLVYLPVGSFKEIESAFPPNHVSLMPASLPGQGQACHVQGALKADLKSKAQALLRPLKNRRTNATAHQLLSHGGQLVFCGMVRPNASVYENFFRGATHSLRPHMAPLIDLEWRRPASDLHAIIETSWEALRSVQPHTAADWACHYTWANVLHRMTTLCHVNALTPMLLVNEFGMGPHIDPYDASAYRHNQFMDFGSTRGPDLIYPRSVDLYLNQKPCLPSRLITPDGALATLLQRTTGSAFWTRCQQEAQRQVQALTALRG